MAKALLVINDPVTGRPVIALGPDGQPLVGDPATGEGWDCCCGTGPCGCFDIVSESCGINGGTVSYNLGAAFVGTYDLTQTYYTEGNFSSVPTRYTRTRTMRMVARLFHDVNSAGRCVARATCLEALSRVREYNTFINTGEVFNDTTDERLGCANWDGQAAASLYHNLTTAMQDFTEEFLPFMPSHFINGISTALDPEWNPEGACTQVERFRNNYFGRGEIYATRTTTMNLSPLARSISMVVPAYSLINNQGSIVTRGAGSHVASVGIVVEQGCNGAPAGEGGCAGCSNDPPTGTTPEALLALIGRQ